MNIVKWSSQGMLRLTQEAMNELFQPTIVKIVKHIGENHKNNTFLSVRQKVKLSIYQFYSIFPYLLQRS